ncbi:nucleotidyltransferase family protein [Hydrogenophaga sp.]|uniref:nucleotidyltransferase domain-containing protein n=1 Tax=Hydrogenophaga sp. TaxID=1904254 RepID=UPI0035623241
MNAGNWPSLAPLLGALAQPPALSALAPAQWDLLVRQGRRADVLARIGAAALSAGRWDAVPSSARVHLGSALKLAQRQHTELRHEVQEVARALAPTGLPVVLLKGAAYVVQDLPAAMGRMVSDLDILVPRDRLADVESALMMGGWVSTNRDAYDQRYYRSWMHELPPLEHMKRGTVLDVHHAIMPLTARLQPDTGQLLQASLAVGGREDIRVLCPADMVLHSATHLFHESELELGLRGLVDLDALLRDFGRDATFWDVLQARAVVHQLEWPMFLALRYCGMFLQTPTPPQFASALLGAASRRRRPTPLSCMDALYLRALRPPHASANDAWTLPARWLLYLRGHWLRMPPALLLWHLLRKLFTPLYAKTHP